MTKFAARASTAMAVALTCTAFCLPAVAQSQGSLSLPLPAAPVAAPSPTPPIESTHARSAHRTLKLEHPALSQTEAEAGNSPLQGAGPPQGNPPPVAVAGGGPLIASPLQGAGPMSAREMLLGSASTFGTK
jgi:hypothetical protein